MAKELTGCGKFLVWIAAPIAAGLVGYFVVGPNVGGIGLGDSVPGIRSLGQELAKKVGKGSAKPSKPAVRGSKPTPPPASDGATEFQRIRNDKEETPSRNRRTPVDNVD